MKCFILAAAVGAILMSGCASDGTQGPGDHEINREDAPLGSLIKRKPGTGSGPASVSEADMQALENARMTNNATRNLPIK